MIVPLDDGTHFIDQNGHCMKLFTLLQLIEAVQDMTDRRATQSSIGYPLILLRTLVAFGDAL